MRGTFGVLSLNHCASACADVRHTAAAATRTLEKRDIDEAPFFDLGLIRRYLYIPIRMRQARDFSRAFEGRDCDAAFESDRIKLQPSGLRHNPSAQPDAHGLRPGGGRRATARRNGTRSTYAFDRHDVGLPGIAKKGVPPAPPREPVGLPGLTAMP